MVVTGNGPRHLLGQPVFGRGGCRLGTVGQVFVDTVTGQAEWVTVQTAGLGSAERFVPLAAAQPCNGGIAVPLSRSAVDEAPTVKPGMRHLTAAQEAGLYEYYGLAADPGLPPDRARTTPGPTRRGADAGAVQGRLCRFVIT